MKLLSTLFVLLLSFNLALAQDKEKKTEPGVQVNTFELKAYSGGPIINYPGITSETPSINNKIRTIDFDELPEIIILKFENGKQRDKVLKFSKVEIWRFITYFHDAYLEHVNRAYDMDQPKDAK